VWKCISNQKKKKTKLEKIGVVAVVFGNFFYLICVGH